MHIITAYEFAFIIAFIFNFYNFHASSRQCMMCMRVFGAIFAAYYFYGVGAQSAVIACMISALSSGVQALFNDKLLESTKSFRLALGIIAAVLGLLVSVNNANEALPLVALVISRLAEAQSCKQRIRLGFLFVQILWVVYALNSGLLLLYIAENLHLLSNLYAIWCYERHKKASLVVE